MTRTALLNPFNLNLNQEPAQVSNRRALLRATRATPVCSECRSDDIVAQAMVQWSNESQQWELADTFGLPAHCNGCNHACEITWLPQN